LVGEIHPILIIPVKPHHLIEQRVLRLGVQTFVFLVQFHLLFGLLLLSESIIDARRSEVRRPEARE